MYHYAGNNPIRYIDPDGRSTTLDDFAYKKRMEGNNSEANYYEQLAAERNPQRFDNPSSSRYSWDKFKQDIKPVINCDFGYDYSQAAYKSWKNGNYLLAALYELDSMAELLYDVAFAYGGAKVAYAVITGIPMIYSSITALASGSTVVLGKYQGGACGGYVQMANKIGGNCFQIPNSLYNLLQKFSQFGEKINTLWLRSVINSGNRILLNTDPELVTAEANKSLYMEINMLKDAGYKFIQIVEKGIDCWEAIK